MTWVCLSESMSNGSQPTITPHLIDPMPLASVGTCTRAHTNPRGDQHTFFYFNNINKGDFFFTLTI